LKKCRGCGSITVHKIMCILLMAIGIHPTYKLILASNRDEYYSRPSLTAEFWEDRPDILAGRDQKAGGTWLGITRTGRLGALTNYRDPSSLREDTTSRGDLVDRFLRGTLQPPEYIKGLIHEAETYNGFNLIVGEKNRLYWYSNRGNGFRELKPGIYGLSNRLLDTPWPKVVRGKKAIERVLSESGDPEPPAFFEILSDREVPDDKLLPDTGVGIEWERRLAPLFIMSPDYGTRASTVLLIDKWDRVTFTEKAFGPGARHLSKIKREFRIKH